MAVTGIIAEYNPFHRGHAWQVAEIRRRLGADCAVVAVMSGNFVQRGEPAILSKHARAESALLGGVDLVLELPVAHAAATAETFARGGVALLEATGVVTHLCFGSESGDLPALRRTAETLDSGVYQETVRQFLGQGMAFAAARQSAAEMLAGPASACLSRPNDNLGVEYLRALSALGSNMEVLTVRRRGAAHDSQDVDGFASASLIRRRILAGEPWQDLLPDGTARVLAREMAGGRAPVSIADCERMMLARLRTMDEESFRLYDGGGEGLYHRFYAAVHNSASLEELLERAKTKRYSHARLRRMALAAWLGLAAPEPPAYLRVLGANRRGCGLLRAMKSKASLPVLTKPADVGKLGEIAARQFAEESRSTDLYTLAWPVPGRAGAEYTAGPVILADTVF